MCAHSQWHFICSFFLLLCIYNIASITMDKRYSAWNKFRELEFVSIYTVANQTTITITTTVHRLKKKEKWIKGIHSKRPKRSLFSHKPIIFCTTIKPLGIYKVAKISTTKKWTDLKSQMTIDDCTLILQFISKVFAFYFGLKQ